MMAPATPLSRETVQLDDVTLARARKGEPAAFQRLVELYQDAVFHLLWRVLGHRAQRALVEDLAQETFLGVYRSLSRFTTEGPARLSTWILTIASRTALKELRKRRLLPARIDDLDEVIAASDRTDAYTEHRAFAAALRRSLEAMRPEWRLVFVLREYHDFDYDEIARALELDLGTVKSRLSRARAQVRTDLKEFEP
jgi:RNA polymerase sigma-70 factor (ECF subfamily)